MKNLNEIIQFAKEGKSIQEIANLLGYKSTSYISRVLEKNNQPVRRLYKNGDFIWELHGKLHRENGPAHEFADGTRWWYLHGEVHREDGPAYEQANGTTQAGTPRQAIRLWYWRGKRLYVESQEEFEKFIQLLLIQEVQES